MERYDGSRSSINTPKELQTMQVEQFQDPVELAQLEAAQQEYLEAQRKLEEQLSRVQPHVGGLATAAARVDLARSA